MKPLVSFIVPVYNAMPYLEDCLEGILGQTVKDWECIVVDDGSTDGSGALGDAYAGRDARVRVIHQERSRQGSARNRGVEASLGEWVCFVDADDYIHPRFLERLLEAALSHGANAAFCDLSRGEEVDEAFLIKAADRGRGSYSFSGKEGVLLRLYDQENIHYWICCGAIYRREVPLGHPFPEGRAFEDNAVAPAYIHRAGKVAVLEEELYFYRKTPGSSSDAGNLAAKEDYLEALLDQLSFARKEGFLQLEGRLCTRYVLDAAYYSRLAREAGQTQLSRHLSNKALRFWAANRRKVQLQGKRRRVLFDALGFGR